MTASILKRLTLIAILHAILSSDAHSAVIAHYDFDAGGAGENFDQAGNDSADTELNSTASRLASSTLDGGGATNLFNTGHNGGAPGSTSGTPLSNWGNANLAEGSANTATFTSSPLAGFQITYEDLSFFNGSFDGTGSVKISYQIGSGSFIDVITAANTGGDNNSPLNSQSQDFIDFTTTEVVTWQISLFGNSGDTIGTRLDDIIINGTVTAIPEPSSLLLASFGAFGLLLRRRR